ncbi:MAG: hypothetical protein GY841_20840 [FCB group bacterium]|nr:hypothetical protein [FCB group bacterium]
MRRALLVLGMILVAASMAFIGCSDDEDCPTCVTTAQKAVMFGGGQLDDGELEFYCYLIGIDGLIPDIDSVKVDGQKADMESGYGEGGGMVWAEYEGPAGGLDSGDDITVVVYTPTGTSSVTFTLLEDEVDDAQAIGWEMDYPYDTVALDQSIEITWNSIPNADWYFFDYDYSFDSAGTNVYRGNKEIYMTDTTFTIPASETGYNGYYYIDITAVAGPSPDASTGNVTGDVVKGMVISTCYNSFQIYLGTGDAWPVAAAPNPMENDKLRAVEVLMNMHLNK